MRLLARFVADTRSDALGVEEFAALARRHLDSGEIGAHTRFVGDLWRLFEPDYQRRLPAYYRATEHHALLRMVEYAGDEAFVREHFLAPYVFARARLGKARILEVGGGLPHGLVRSVLAEERFCEHLTLCEIEVVYSRFVEWFCEQYKVPFDLVRADAGETAALPDGPFDFVFAKDVFEHLVDPLAMLDQIVAAASPHAVLALDVEDKGERVYQHVQPDLSALRSFLSDGGWHEAAKSGSVTTYVHRDHADVLS